MKCFRKEEKYLLGPERMAFLEERIRGILKRDENQRGDGYLIRSVYFDSPDDICVRENEAGISRREKYRIRTYNRSDSLILAEIKLRIKDTISKMSTALSKETFLKLVSEGDLSGLYEALNKSELREREVLERYIAKLSGELYMPKAVIEYIRSAYVYEPGNVRITFDKNIRASGEVKKFFDESLSGIPVLGNGLNVLEVKYDELLPAEIEELLSGFALRACPVSKYCLGRQALGRF